MGFGNYDEQEHEKREEKMDIETSEESLAEQHNGEVTREDSGNTTELLDQLETIKENNDSN